MTARVLIKILLGPGTLVKLAIYKLSLFTFCLTQLVGCKFGLNTRTKQNLDTVAYRNCFFNTYENNLSFWNVLPHQGDYLRKYLFNLVI